MSIPENEEKEIYRVINDALLSLCEEKPNDPVDYLSRKMLELIGEDPTKAVRKVEKTSDDKQNEHIILSPEKLALKSLHQNFYDNYKITEELSTNCYVVEDLKLGNANEQPKCVRIIDKSISPILMSDRKIKMLINLSHANIIKIFQILEDENFLYVVTDYCPGKDIFTYYYHYKDQMTESLIRQTINQLLNALDYLHKQGIIHKNINPYKVLVYNQEFDKHDIHIKLGDFINNTETFSKKSFTYQGFNNTITDPLYIAPEFIEGKYNNKVDIWSVGIIAYLLFVGEPPFKGNKSEILYQISHKKISFPEGLNQYKKKLLQKMLAQNPNERYEAEELLKDEYFQVEPNELISQFGLEPGSVSGNPNKVEVNNEEVEDTYHALNNINNFVCTTNLKRSVISYIISRKLYLENDKKLRKIFQELDKDNSGDIDTHEIYSKYKLFFPGTPEKKWKEIESLIEVADTNKNGKIDYAEFLTVIGMSNIEMNKKILRNVFDFYDDNKNGYIEASDIKEIFEDTGLSDKQIHEMLDEVDLNGDRQISFEEFYKMITDKL